MPFCCTQGSAEVRARRPVASVWERGKTCSAMGIQPGPVEKVLWHLRFCSALRARLGMPPKRSGGRVAAEWRQKGPLAAEGRRQVGLNNSLVRFF